MISSRKNVKKNIEFDVSLHKNQAMSEKAVRVRFAPSPTGPLHGWCAYSIIQLPFR